MNLKMILAAAFAASIWGAGCDRDQSNPGPQPQSGGAPSTQPVEADHQDEEIDLGTQATGGLSVKATLDGAIKPGDDEAHVDLTVTGGEKPKAVRAWIGVESAQGSVKEAADAAKVAGGQHLHVEIPSPLPPGSKLWIELETASGKYTASFDINKK
jgi:hypothetical protein